MPGGLCEDVVLDMTRAGYLYGRFEMSMYWTLTLSGRVSSSPLADFSVYAASLTVVQYLWFHRPVCSPTVCFEGDSVTP